MGNYHLSLTPNPSFAIMTYEDHFIYLEARIGDIVRAHHIESCIGHINYVKNLLSKKGLGESFRVRKLFYNDKAGMYTCYLDYFSDGNTTTIDSIEEISRENYIFWLGHNQIITNLQIENRMNNWMNDYFNVNHRCFYLQKEIIPTAMVDFMKEVITSAEDW